MQDILDFLTQLACNNTREWFIANKDWYKRCSARFVQLSEEYISRLSELDPELKGLTPKDCIWRIYRDVRFSADKRPYKEWFGVFPAAKGGKKSLHAGYYLHLQPGHCMFAAGIWCPNPDLLKALRQEIVANYDEVEDLMNRPDFKKYFVDFDTDWMLKKTPKEFNLEGIESPYRERVEEWIKRKAFTISTPLSDELVCSPDFMDKLVQIASAAKPMNDFLNYTFVEYGEFPSRM